MSDHHIPDIYEALALMRDAEAEIASFIETSARLIKLSGLNDQSRDTMEEAGSRLSDLAQHLLSCDRNQIYSIRLQELLQ